MVSLEPKPNAYLYCGCNGETNLSQQIEFSHHTNRFISGFNGLDEDYVNAQIIIKPNPKILPWLWRHR